MTLDHLFADTVAEIESGVKSPCGTSAPCKRWAVARDALPR
jgi:hypothetical protein